MLIHGAVRLPSCTRGGKSGSDSRIQFMGVGGLCDAGGPLVLWWFPSFACKNGSPIALASCLVVALLLVQEVVIHPELYQAFKSYEVYESLQAS